MNKKFLMLTCASMLIFGANNAWAGDHKAEAPTPPRQEMPVKGKPHKFGMHGDKLADALELTPEQRKKAEEIRKADFERMKPLMEQMKELHKKMDEMRKENMKAFEAILTPIQKAKLDGIMLERKNQMEQFKKGPRPDGRRPDRHHPEMDRRHAPDGHMPPAPDGQPEPAAE